MSLWLQSAIQALQGGAYQDFREKILPHAPIRIPDCLLRELEFAERRCRDQKIDSFFPIRFLWLMEAHEQRMFGLRTSGRSLYHPEKLLELWNQALVNMQYRQECEADGSRFDFAEKAVDLGMGWIYIGDRFSDDLLEVETTLGVELFFSNPPASDGQPAFREFKRSKSGGGHPVGPGAVGDGDMHSG